MKIYVGNLPHELTEEELRQEFGNFGAVGSVNIMKDRYSGDSRGFGFVEMASVSEGRAAITVNAARPPSQARGGASYGGNRSPGGWPRKTWKSRY